MAFATEFNPTVYSNPYAINNKDAGVVPATVTRFQRLTVDDQLAVLWFVYTELGKMITPAAPGAARLQLAEGLLEQVKQLPHSEQLAFMRNLAAKVSTPLTRSYGVFTANTKLGFWYQLAELMTQGVVIPMPEPYKLSGAARDVLIAIEQLEMNQQITVLRNVVVNMGVDPLA